MFKMIKHSINLSLRHASMIVMALLLLTSTSYGNSGQDAARKALASGEILPLKTMLDLLEKALPNHNIIKVKFEQDDGLYIYELKVIDEKGVIREVEMNAKTGEILDIEVDD